MKILIKSLVILFLASGFIGINATSDEEFLFAVKTKKIEEVKKIIESGVNINAKDAYERNALFYSIDRKEPGLVKLLLEHGVSAYTLDKEKNSPLSKAVVIGSDEIVDLLLQYGTDIHAIDRNHENALDLALAYGYKEIAIKLENRGLTSKKKYISNIIIGLYIFYLMISISMTIWVARTLFKNGRVFLEDAFKNTELANSVNHLLVVGFYLINIGYISLALKIGIKPNDYVESIETLSWKVGLVLVILGIMHFFNLYLFGRLRKRTEYKKMMEKEIKS